MVEQRTSEETPTAPSPEEGRIYERHDCQLPGACGPVSSWTRSGAKWGGTITNISLGGVRLHLPRRFEPGSGLAIELPDTGSGTCVVFATVVHARHAGDESWELGCKFISELGEDEFHRLLYAPPHLATFSPHEPPAGRASPVAPSELVSDEDDAPGTPDQRCHHRHQPLESNVLRLAIRPAFGGRPALLADVSAGGVALVLDRPLEAGDVLAVELSDPDGGGAPRLAEVRHCRPCPVPADAPWLPRIPPLLAFCRRLFGLPTPPPPGPAWVIGCRFTRPLDEGELVGLLDLSRRAAAGDDRTAS